MGINASQVKSNNSNPQDLLETDNYPARIWAFIDEGIQPQKPYQGQEKPPVQKVMLIYELADVFMKDEAGNDVLDKPRVISEELPFYSLSSDRAVITQRYKALDPQVTHKGDWSKLVGAPCSVAVVQNPSKTQPGKIYNNVANIARPPRGVTVPELVNQPIIFDMDNPDLETYNRIPKWIQEKIVNGLEFKGSKLDALLSGKQPAKADTAASAAVAEDSDTSNLY